MIQLFWLVPALLFFACSPKRPSPISTSMLAAQQFTISGERDTILHTLHGSIIKISANSFSEQGKIDIEVKEAFSAAEIMSAGLATASNGRPLRRGGMIYINASADGNELTLNNPIQLSVPNDFYDPSMNIFSGEVNPDGSINWVDPYAVDTTTPQAGQYQSGKILFESKCASCHVMGINATAPDLRGVDDRISDRDKIYRFVKDPARVIYEDPYFFRLKNKYGQLMTSYPDISRQQVDDILYYVNNKSKEILPSVSEDFPEIDTATDSLNDYNQSDCGEYTVYIPVPKNDSSYFEQSPSPSPVILADTIPAKAESLEDLRQGFTDYNSTAGMYDFEIKTLGWYNIDAFVEGYDGTSNVKVWAKLSGEQLSGLSLYLFCPDKKMLSIANSIQNDGRYFFDKIDNGIPLFINDRAILFAFGSVEDKMYFGITEFYVRNEQEVKIAIRETNAEELRDALYNKKIEGIDIHSEKKEKKIIRIDCDGHTAADTVNTK